MEVITTIEDTIVTLNAPRQCMHCRLWYTEMQSIGAHECRRHTGHVQSVMVAYGGKLDTFSCCGVSPYGWHEDYQGEEAALGCVACDHTDEPGLPENISLTAERAEIIFSRELHGRKVVRDVRTGMLTIVRRAPKLVR